MKELLIEYPAITTRILRLLSSEEIPDLQSGEYSVYKEVYMACGVGTSRRYHFEDSARIDVAICYQKRIYPLEMKMGMTVRGSGRNGLVPCLEGVRIENGNGTKLTGTVVSILGRLCQRGDVVVSQALDSLCGCVPVNGRNRWLPVHRSWLLVVRTRAIKKSLGKESDILLPRTHRRLQGRILTFGELLGRKPDYTLDHKIRRILVREMDARKSFFARWEMTR